MIVVSDTSPLINLAAIGRLDLVPALFKQVVVSPAVFQEIVVRGAGQPGAAEVENAAWVQVRPCQDWALLSTICSEKDIHRGEAEAICLALELGADALLLDDAAGRELARAYQLPFIGILGILLKAKGLGLIPAVEPLMRRLQSEAGFFIHQQLFSEVLTLAGEQKTPS